MAELIRPVASVLEVPCSNPGLAVPLKQGTFGGEFEPSVPCIGDSYPMHVKKTTSLLAIEQGEIPVQWSDRQTYSGLSTMDECCQSLVVISKDQLTQIS